MTSQARAGSERRSVLLGEEEAASWIESGMTIAIGGLLLSSHPMAIVRQIIRRGIRDLTVIGAPSAGLEIDLLIAAGCVSKLVTAYVGGEGIVAVGPAFKAACEAGSLELWECDESIFYAALRAGAQGLPSMPSKGLLGTSYPQLNRRLVPYEDPVTGEPLLAVPALRADIAVLHASQADVYGNVQYVGTGFGDRALYNAADRTIVQVERIVPVEEIRRDPLRTAIPYVDAVVRAPFGAHPFASPGFYLEDARLLNEYVQAARQAKENDASGLEQFVRRYVRDPRDHVDYLEAVGLRRLLDLHEY